MGEGGGVGVCVVTVRYMNHVGIMSTVEPPLKETPNNIMNRITCPKTSLSYNSAKSV